MQYVLGCASCGQTDCKKVAWLYNVNCFKSLSMDYHDFFAKALKGLRNEGRYRVFADLKRHAGTFPRASFYDSAGRSRDVVVWCSNDYLGMGQIFQRVDLLMEIIS